MAADVNQKTFIHLMPSEKKLWITFMREYGHLWNGYVYDVHVGQGRPAPEEYPENIKAMALSISQYRIDVIARKAGVLWIFEVKPYAGTAALGQLDSYVDLYRWTFGFSDPIRKALVTDVLRPDIKALADARGITVYVVEPSVY